MNVIFQCVPVYFKHQTDKIDNIDNLTYCKHILCQTESLINKNFYNINIDKLKNSLDTQTILIFQIPCIKHLDVSKLSMEVEGPEITNLGDPGLLQKHKSQGTRTSLTFQHRRLTTLACLVFEIKHQSQGVLSVISLMLKILKVYKN